MQDNQMKYATLEQLANEMFVSLSTLKIKLSTANRRGIALPARKRIGKQFLYDRIEFTNWLWANADDIRRKFEMKSKSE